ncbi:MAG: glycoside hydrolase family 31 protein [Acholeplasmataceae bacterium]|jgi:alpha-D-xyloside xylohydrolase|nr:glycoside hydrolase family 31 protein [Acholeplasmataceae bacterium]
MIIDQKTLASFSNQTIELNNYVISVKKDAFIIDGDTSFVYGLGERFNSVNQKGLVVENKVIEQFCHQGDKTYFPLPFFFLEDGFGLFIDTKRIFNYDLTDNIKIDVSHLDPETVIYIFKGTYKEIISDFIGLNGKAMVPPKWIFGPWMSAHRWNSEKLINEQLDILDELDLPVTALVIEQWSDEATFYMFNGSTYDVKDGIHNYDEYTYDQNGLWPNPKKMIEHIHKKGLKVLLWQAPVVKELDIGESENFQHTVDKKYVVDNDLVVKVHSDPYRIPQDKWFKGSYVPDFSNPTLVKWWFEKRKYLMDIGIDGYKSDGGEFIHDLDATFFNGQSGKEMWNDYARLFIESYKNSLNDQQVLFSRAGYTGQQSNTILWAGDQKSTWSEFRSVYNAGLSVSLSGQHLWSFDIGGFAGDLPSIELYIRSTQLALFTPVMQFHSEPIGGQFSLLDPSEIMNNERSPWNMANYYDRPDILPYLQKLYWLRMNLLPYIYSETLKAIDHKKTVMKHLIVDFPDDEKVRLLDSQHLFGDLLTAPILYENIESVSVYLPKGDWVNIVTEDVFEGEKAYLFKASLFDFFAFIKKGTALAINSNSLFSKSKNRLEYENLHVWLYGNKGSYTFKDDLYNFTINWENKHHKILGHYPKKLTVLYK